MAMLPPGLTRGQSSAMRSMRSMRPASDSAAVQRPGDGAAGQSPKHNEQQQASGNNWLFTVGKLADAVADGQANDEKNVLRTHAMSVAHV